MVYDIARAPSIMWDRDYWTWDTRMKWLLFSCSFLLCNYIIRMWTIHHTILFSNSMGKAPEYGQQMMLKPWYHSWFTFFTLNPVSGQAMLQNPFMPNFLSQNWNHFDIIQEKVLKNSPLFTWCLWLPTLFFSECFHFSKDIHHI